MRQLTCVNYQENSNLEIQEVAEPTPCASDVKIKVLAAGVGYADALLVAGKYQIKPPLPYVPGIEYAGEVVHAGSQVSKLKPGDRVVAFGHAALAEYAIAPAQNCAVLPDNIDISFAGGLLVTYCTAVYGLEQCANLAKGESLLILGASGGLGQAAISVGKAMGAHVIAAASTEEKRQACLQAGADAVVDCDLEGWRERVKALAGNDGLTVVFDLVGGDFSEMAFRCLSAGGRFLVVGYASGVIPSMPLNLPLLKRSSIIGVNFGGNVRANPDFLQPQIARLMALLANNSIQPKAPVCFPLSETETAFKQMLARKSIGKLVIHPQD